MSAAFAPLPLAPMRERLAPKTGPELPLSRGRRARWQRIYSKTPVVGDVLAGWKVVAPLGRTALVAAVAAYAYVECLRCGERSTRVLAQLQADAWQRRVQGHEGCRGSP